MEITMILLLWEILIKIFGHIKELKRRNILINLELESKKKLIIREKISLNEEWYIISIELEAVEIIYQNHIKHSPI